jgi:hypothetical protein
MTFARDSKLHQFAQVRLDRRWVDIPQMQGIPWPTYLDFYLWGIVKNPVQANQQWTLKPVWLLVKQHNCVNVITCQQNTDADFKTNFTKGINICNLSCSPVIGVNIFRDTPYIYIYIYIWHFKYGKRYV